MWGWAADRDHIPMNFLAGVKKAGGKENEKDRVLTADELRAFLPHWPIRTWKRPKPSGWRLKEFC